MAARSSKIGFRTGAWRSLLYYFMGSLQDHGRQAHLLRWVAAPTSHGCSKPWRRKRSGQKNKTFGRMRRKTTCAEAGTTVHTCPCVSMDLWSSAMFAPSTSSTEFGSNLVDHVMKNTGLRLDIAQKPSRSSKYILRSRLDGAPQICCL